MESPVVFPTSFFSWFEWASLLSLLAVKEGTFQQVHPQRAEVIAVGLCLGGGLVDLPRASG